MIDFARTRHVVFDFDGTLSLLTGGWSEVMTDLFIEHLPPPKDREFARREILRLNGKPSIHQMRRLVELIAERGGTPAEAREYHTDFLARLRDLVHERRATLESGRVSAETLLVPGARDFLHALRARGLGLTLLSGSEQRTVQMEARLLGIDEFFTGRILGPDGDDHAFTKRAAFERIVAEHALHGDELLAFGDGPAEIEHTRALGGTAIGIACVEADPRPGRIDEAKREVLVAAGAQAIFADFRALFSK